MTHQFCRKMFPWQHLIQSLEDMEEKWDSEILYREDVSGFFCWFTAC